MPSYELTREADADLADIARYTILEWGMEQANWYMDKLDQCFQKIGTKIVFGRTFSKRMPDVFVTRCEHHFVFYLHPSAEKPVILAVLHERMDMVNRLQDRLA
jgi:plasmid stabilization system protein ParE